MTSRSRRQHARLSENAGYGIDKMLMWEQKRGKVDFTDDVVSSTIVFYLNKAEDTLRFSISDTQGGTQGGTMETTPQKSSQKSSQKVLELISVDDKITTQEMADKLEISRRAVAKTIAKLQSAGILRRVGPDKGGHWEIIPTDR